MSPDKKIFIHDSVHDPAHQRGVNRCFLKYSTALAAEFPNRTFIFSKRNLLIPNHIQIYSSYHYLPDPFPRRITAFVDNLIGAIIANLRTDLYYSPYYGGIKCNIPQVFTVHDMIYEKYPNIFSDIDSKRFIKEKKECFARAALLLCVSKNTANDLQSIYPWIPPEKIRVVYNGVEESFFEEKKTIKAGKPYFLYVGNRHHYKNFIRLLTAYGKSGLAKSFDLRVLSPSDDFPTEKEKEIINQYGVLDSVQVEISVSDEILRQRYQNAFAYVFPSEYEGFGLPLVEAMASRVVSLASNSSSLSEIGQDVPLYFDPLSIDDIVFTLRYASTMTDEERENRKLRGIIQAKKFTWKNSCKKFNTEINSLL